MSVDGAQAKGLFVLFFFLFLFYDAPTIATGTALSHNNL